MKILNYGSVSLSTNGATQVPLDSQVKFAVLYFIYTGSNHFLGSTVVDVASPEPVLITGGAGGEFAHLAGSTLSISKAMQAATVKYTAFG